MTDQELDQIIDELPREKEVTSNSKFGDENTIRELTSSRYMVEPIFYLLPYTHAAGVGVEESYMREKEVMVTSWSVKMAGSKLFTDIGEEIVLRNDQNENLTKAVGEICINNESIES